MTRRGTSGRSSTVAAVFFGGVLVASCGTPMPPVPLDPAALPAVEARSATLEERDTSGTLLWRVAAERARERGGEVSCETVSLLVPGGGVSTVGGSPRGLPAVGFEASAPLGFVRRAPTAESAPVELAGGFSARFENGWTLTGAALRWDGVRLRVAGEMQIERAGMTMRGRDGVIDPRGPRVQMRSVRGAIEGVRL